MGRLPPASNQAWMTALLRVPDVQRPSDGLTTEGQAIQASIVSVALTVARYIGPLHSLGHKDRHNLGAHLRLSFRRVGRDSFVTATDA